MQEQKVEKKVKKKNIKKTKKKIKNYKKFKKRNNKKKIHGGSQIYNNVKLLLFMVAMCLLAVINTTDLLPVVSEQMGILGLGVGAVSAIGIGYKYATSTDNDKKTQQEINSQCKEIIRERSIKMLEEKPKTPMEYIGSRAMADATIHIDEFDTHFKELLIKLFYNLVPLEYFGNKIESSNIAFVKNKCQQNNGGNCNINVGDIVIWRMTDYEVDGSEKIMKPEDWKSTPGNHTYKQISDEKGLVAPIWWTNDIRNATNYKTATSKLLNIKLNKELQTRDSYALDLTDINPEYFIFLILLNINIVHHSEILSDNNERPQCIPINGTYQKNEKLCNSLVSGVFKIIQLLVKKKDNPIYISDILELILRDDSIIRDDLESFNHEIKFRKTSGFNLNWEILNQEYMPNPDNPIYFQPLLKSLMYAYGGIHRNSAYDIDFIFAASLIIFLKFLWII